MDVPERNSLDFVQAHLFELRNRRLRDKIISVAGRTMRINLDTERRIYGPDGRPIKIIQRVRGGVNVEHDDHLHAVVRPPTMRLSVKIRGR